MFISSPVRIQEGDDQVIMVENRSTRPNLVAAAVSVDVFVDAYREIYGEPIEATTDDGRRTWTWQKRPPVDG